MQNEALRRTQLAQGRQACRLGLEQVESGTGKELLGREAEGSEVCTSIDNDARIESAVPEAHEAAFDLLESIGSVSPDNSVRRMRQQPLDEFLQRRTPRD
jgi:hypothetical protein